MDEIDLCLVLSNLLENAFEASLRTTPARRRIEVTAYVPVSYTHLMDGLSGMDAAKELRKRA